MNSFYFINYITTFVNSPYYMHFIMLFFYLIIPVGLSRLLRQKWKNILIAYAVWIALLTLWGISLGINEAGWTVLVALFTTFFMIPLLSFIVHLLSYFKKPKTNE